MHCPRRFENPLHPSPYGGEDHWEEYDGYRHCSYCGSLHPEELFAAVAEGRELLPTDKNYKTYVILADKNAGTLRVSSTTNFDPNDARYKRVSDLSAEEREMVKDDPWLLDAPTERWVMLEPRGPKKTEKFYFQHFSKEDCTRFTRMLRDGVLNIGSPGRFYRTPYFVGAET